MIDVAIVVFTVGVSLFCGWVLANPFVQPDELLPVGVDSSDTSKRGIKGLDPLHNSIRREESMRALEELELDFLARKLDEDQYKDLRRELISRVL